MLKKIVLVIPFICISFFGIAQKDINNYKYIIVPKKYEFVSSEDQFQLNSLTKFLFNKYGYKAYFPDDNLPEDLESDRCLALTSEVIKEKSGMFKTILSITLKDCYGTTVMTSELGESRLKEYNKAYTEALRNAFETYQTLDYTYVPKAESVAQRNESIKTEKVSLDTKGVEAETIEAVNDQDVTNQKSEVVSVNQQTSEMYYAQAINNGFQLVNAEPKIVMILLSTAAKDVFAVKDKNAIVFKKGDDWVYSENNGDAITENVLLIKF